jgi:hypothetical protein
VSKNRAVVLERIDGFYHVLDSDGNFRRICSPVNVEVGEEIELAAYQINRKAKVLLSIVALFLLTVVSTFSWSSLQTPIVVATLSVDINPSFELTLDKNENVVDVGAKNDDARDLLQGINFKGQTLIQVLSILVTRAVELDYLNQERKLIVLGFSQGTMETLGCEVSEASEEKDTGQTDIVVDSQALLSGLNEVAASKGLDLEVVMFNLNSREGSDAEKNGLSLGEYALWQTAEKAGVAVPSQTVKDSKERSHLVKVPAVKTQLKQNYHEIKSKKSVGNSTTKTLKASRSQAKKAGVAVPSQTVKDSKERSHLVKVPAVKTQLKQNYHEIRSKKFAGHFKQKDIKSFKILKREK